MTKIIKPKIRPSRNRKGILICTGLGCTGYGKTFRAAWQVWKTEMILKGKRDKIPY